MNSIELTKVYAQLDHFELSDITLAIPKGAIVGLVGRNGAGKTTLIKTFMGARFVSQGGIKIHGLTYKEDEKAIREQIAVVYDVFNVNPLTKGKRLLKVYKSAHPKFDEEVFNHIQNTFDLAMQTPISKLSLGMQKKLMIAFALAVKPKVLLLDEPTIGIDPIDKAEVIRMMQTYMENEENTLILSSHYIEDVERISDYICFIDQGKIVLFEDKETLLSSYVYVQCDKTHKAIEAMISPKLNAFGVEGIMKKSDADHYGIASSRATLEQLFVHLCAKEERV